MSRPAGSSKRKRDALEDDYTGGIENEMHKSMHGSKKRNTIDSDSEEENGEDYNKLKHSVMRDEDIEGQEDHEGEEAEFDGETKITPFNMKDEMEEGYFDGQGTYIWNKKDASEVKDNWLDSVDWMKLKKETTKEKEARVLAPQPDSDSDSSLDATQLTDKGFTVPYYRECLSYMKPGENILRAIKRHGGGKTLSASERLKQKKLAKLQGETSTGPVSMETSDQDKTKADSVSRITEIANKFIGLGDMDFYQETYESLSHKIEIFNRAPKSNIPETATSDGLDMFSTE